MLCARREDVLRGVAKEVELLGRRAVVVRCDVCRDGDVEKAVRVAVECFGKLDVVVANAGFGVVGGVRDLSLEDFRRQFETNVYGVLRTAKASLAELEKTKGRLALMGSVSGYVSIPGTAAYAMSKFAVRALADALWWEEKGKGISVTHIAPGFVESEIRRVDNEGKHNPGIKEDVPQWLVVPAGKAARQMVRAIHRRRREVVVTGHGKAAVWFQRHIPAVMSIVIRSGIRGRRPAQHD